MIRWNSDGIYYYAAILFWAHFVLSMGVWFLYAVKSVSTRGYGSMIRRLGIVASLSSVWLVFVPTFLMAVWQVASIIAPLRRTSLLGFFFFTRYRIQIFNDPVQVFGFVLLMSSTIWIVTKVLRRHSMCAKRLQQALRGSARPIIDDD